MSLPAAAIPEAGSEAIAPDPPWLDSRGLELADQILSSHHSTWGRPLLALPSDAPPRLRAQELFSAAAVVLAHDGGADPRLIYANRAALSLWRRTWNTMVGMPSRLTAAASERPARAGALADALRTGGIRGYGGIRIDSAGRRFRIEAARLWTLRDAQGRTCGQAARFSSWWWI